MSDWSEGYVTDIGYTYGYYAEMNPVRFPVALGASGLQTPQIRTACELGFGQGMAPNLLGASSLTSWYGTDFNPAQAGFAQELAAASGADVHLYDQSFEEFCTRTDLPQFDYIALHGIWSWIDEKNRSIITDFLRRKLKIGGIAYISYNTLPGWSGFAPLQHLMSYHRDIFGTADGNVLDHISAARDFVHEFIELEPAIKGAAPQAMGRLNQMKDKDPAYLAHEYFNQNWHPKYFSEVAKTLSLAKLDYACSASYHDNVDVLHFNDKQRALLNKQKNPVFRQTLRDFLVNQQFRKDIWIRGPRNLSVYSAQQHLREQRVVLTRAPEKVDLKQRTLRGELNLTSEPYKHLLEALADRQVTTVRDLETKLSPHGISISALLQMMMFLIGKGSLTPVQSEEIADQAQATSDRLNAHLTQMASNQEHKGYLASPVLGGGLRVGMLAQQFMDARAKGHSQPQDIIKSVWHNMSARGLKLKKDGKALQTDHDNLAHLVEHYKTYEAEELPMLKTLRVVSDA